MVVVVLSWLVMVGVGASLPAEYQGWFRSAVSVGVAAVTGLGRLVQAMVGSAGGDAAVVRGFVGLSPVWVGLAVSSVLVGAGARPAARWVFRDAALDDG